jgi:hypothetical protein
MIGEELVTVTASAAHGQLREPWSRATMAVACSLPRSVLFPFTVVLDYAAVRNGVLQLDSFLRARPNGPCPFL